MGPVTIGVFSGLWVQWLLEYAGVTGWNLPQYVRCCFENLHTNLWKYNEIQCKLLTLTRTILVCRRKKDIPRLPEVRSLELLKKIEGCMSIIVIKYWNSPTWNQSHPGPRLRRQIGRFTGFCWNDDKIEKGDRCEGQPSGPYSNTYN